jgi:cation:H+ antiporter
VATATSLPELVSSLAAVRLGAFDLAVGNLFGSNVFNMGVLFLLDIVHQPNPLLSAVSVTHTVAALLSIDCIDEHWAHGDYLSSRETIHVNRAR